MYVAGDTKGTAYVWALTRYAFFFSKSVKWKLNIK